LKSGGIETSTGAAAWPPVRPWPSLDPQFSLVRTGVFPSYSRSNDRLLCNSERAGSLHNDILVMDLQGDHRSTLFHDPVKNALGPVWSPTGDRIAFAVGGFFQTIDGLAIADIAVMHGDGTALQILTDGSGNVGFRAWR
jgi:TolB protein